MRNRLALTVASVLAVSLVGAAPTTQPAGAEGKAAALFEKLKSLAGKWEGTVDGGMALKVEYTVTGNGSAVVEHQDLHGGMTTVYTLDKDRVLLTHYCAAGNQPRMASPGLDAGTAVFSFLDATGMATPDDPHMHNLTLTFPDGGLHHDWELFVAGKSAMVVAFDLKPAK